MADIRQTKVPKRISDIEAAEYQRKGRDVFASMMKDTATELKKNAKEVGFSNFIAASTTYNINC